jgi:hypothetical protein
MRAIFRILAPLALLLSLLVPAGAATADSTNAAVSERDTTFSVLVNDCTGETIRVEGALHVDYEVQLDWAILVHVEAQGEAFGSQGNEYVFNESYDKRLTLGDYSLDYRAILTSQGSAPDEALLIHYDPSSGLAYELECNG